MTPLEAMRELARNSLKTLTITGKMVCVFCGRGECRNNCLRFDLPQIVAALEEAQVRAGQCVCSEAQEAR